MTETANRAGARKSGKGRGVTIERIYDPWRAPLRRGHLGEA